MAIRFADSFDMYAASADLVKKWSSNSNSATTIFSPGNGRWGGGCLRNTTNSFLDLGLPVPLPDNRAIIGLWVRASAQPASEQNIVSFRTLGGGQGGGLTLNTAGRMGAYPILAAASSALGSSATIMTDNQWHWIVFDVRYQDVGGWARLWVDGNLEVDFAGDTVNGAGTADMLSVFRLSGHSTSVVDFDDVVLCDNTGSRFNQGSDLIRPLRLRVLQPNGAGANTGFTSSGGANYAAVNEAVADEDTSYVEAVLGEKDTYAHSDLTGTPTIKAVVVNTRARNPNTGVINIQHLARSSGVEGAGSAVALAGPYKTQQGVFEVDPNTGLAWEVSALNAAELGFKAA